MAELAMKMGALQLYSTRRSISSLSGQTKCIVGTICSVTPLSISLRHSSAPDLNYKLRKSNLIITISGIAKEPADGINSESSRDDIQSGKSLSRTVLPGRHAIILGSLGIRTDNASLAHSRSPWGLASIHGRRQKLEDAVVVIRRFSLTGDHVNDGTTTPLSQLAVPFFGVYDGHGGSRVANYCQDRLHSALAEELEVIMVNLNGTGKDILEEEWRRAFTKCFRKVDDDVGGKAGVGPHVAPETVGSTAVVATSFSSHPCVARET